MRRLSLAIGALLLPLLIAGCGSRAEPAVSNSAVTSAATVVTVPPVIPATTVPTTAPIPAPTGPVTDPLIGGDVIDRPVIAVKIDNTSAGLPHYGVSDADMVYVEQVEGGLTRLMAVYHSNLPTEVGAVRSVRTTDAELLPVFGVPALVFSGGGGIPLEALAATTVHAVSEEAGAPGFWRSGGASEPYNLHANVQDIAGATSGLTPARDIGLVFAGTDPRVEAGPAATSLEVRYQAAQLGFSFVDGRYQLVGAGDTDASGTPLVADNVLFQNVAFEPDGEVDSVGSPSFISHTVGSGTFTLYRDGHAITGTWNRPAPDQPTQYLDEAGQPVPFKPGKTWVALVPPVASIDVS